MSARNRQRRLPISCEPCRLRKIRCSRPRGPPPCETCIRRSLASECSYAGGHQTASPARPLLPPSPLSEQGVTDSHSLNEDLAERVAKLESLLRAQNGSANNPSNVHYTLAPPVKKGSLAISTSGHVRFIPLQESDRNRDSLHSPQQAAACSIDLSSGPFPFGKRDVEISQFLNLLPVRSHCRQLVDVYLESFASLFHLLHEPTFREQYAKFEQAPQSTSLSWLALLFAILGTAVTALDSSSQLLRDLSWSSTAAEMVAELSERYRTTALKCLESDNYLWQQNVTTLQALIVLIYGINHSHGQTWTLLGMAYHIALSIGCHVDPAEFDLDVVKSEERRRCWASVMMLYMLQNTSLGHLGPDPRQASEGVRLPADLNDSDLIADEHTLPIASGGATQMSYLLLKFRLYEIASDIRSLVLNETQPSTTLIRRMDEMILHEQSSWDERYMEHSTLAPLPVCHEAHINILHGYAHQLTLLLHHKSMRISSSNTSQHRHSTLRCVESAKELLRIHRTFSTSTTLSPFNWYLRGICSFHAFHASVTLIAILTSNTWNEQCTDILTWVQECVTRFETMVDMSSICEKAAPIMRRLVSTVETWSIGLSDHSLTSQLLSESGESASEPLVSPDPHHPSAWPNDNNNLPGDVDQIPQFYVENIFSRLDPNLWMTPSPSSWNQWDSFLNSIPLSTCAV
ncbi:hypothetical protein FB567DRAFT_237088 [Paraphoma chrysanthemicola]|uniref:Zn(2)-C6 fungal-type domain-containing protein n=1 Tax=Paraphoma chrysanthemicola TaxID=798071 RepID=A0A8K0W214_9PLEO|nr:hypothetical protein FB567DRAFT_237088 [Paraphoma chrysanthemicola]